MPLFVCDETESTASLGPKVWDFITEKLKQKESFNDFENAVKKWSPTDCLCRFCSNLLNKWTL